MSNKPQFDPSQPFDVVDDSASNAKPAFDPTQPFEAVSDNAPTPTEEPSSLTALGRGAAQGATLGWADELSGAANAGLDKLEGSDTPFLDLYHQYRDQYRNADAAAKAAHPYIFGAGNIAGAIPSLALTAGAGEGLAGLAGGGKLAGAAAQGAIDAGIMGAGGSTASTPGGVAKDALESAALGGGIGGGLSAAGSAISSAPAQNLLQSAGKKILNVVFDIPEDVSSRYLANPDAVNNAATLPEMGQKIADTFGEMRNDTGPAMEQALSTLSSDRQPNPEMELTRALRALDQFNTPEATSLAQRLRDEYAARANSISPEANPGYLTEREMHDVKQALQQSGNWKSPLPDYQQADARLASSAINQILKENNPDYLSAMRSLSENIQTKKALANQFGIVPDYTGNNDSGVTFSDRTVSALKDLVKGSKFDRARTLQAVKEQGYGDLANDIQNTLANQKLNGGGRSAGSRKTLLGATIGGVVGHATGIPGAGWIGSAVGSAIGATADKYGPRMGKLLMDIATREPQRLGPFASTMVNAAARGSEAFAATHYILSQNSPEYRDLTDKLSSEGQNQTPGQ